MSYRIDTYEVCVECDKFVLRDIRGQHIIIPSDEYCSCGDLE